MKVLVISHMYPSTFNEIGGIFVHQQVIELIKQGCDIKVISPIPWTPFPIKYLRKKWKAYSKIPEKMNWDDVEIYYPRYLEFPKALFSASSGHRMYHGIKETVDKVHREFPFDLIHAYVALSDGWAGMKVAEKYKKPLFITVHGQDFQRTIFKSKKCKENVEKTLNFSNKTIVVSNRLRKLGEENLKIDSDKVIVIPNGINPNDIFKGENNLTQKYIHKKIILSVSHLIRIKGIDLNLKVIAKLKEKYPSLIYLIVGGGRTRKNLEKLARDLVLRDKIEFLGQLPHQKVMEYMSICNIFSLPSWEEGFGIVYLEAMAHGKPVIACKDQGVTDVVKDGETGFLAEPKDVDSLVEDIDFLLSHPGEAKKIGERARKLVLENYTWEKNAEKTIKVYKEALGGR